MDVHAHHAHAVELIRELYTAHPTGGPLHVQLEDGNLYDDQKPFTPAFAIPGYGLRKAIPDDYDERTHQVCNEIAGLLNGMTEEQRFAVRAAAFEGTDHGFGGSPARTGQFISGPDHAQTEMPEHLRPVVASGALGAVSLSHAPGCPEHLVTGLARILPEPSNPLGLPPDELRNQLYGQARLTADEIWAFGYAAGAAAQERLHGHHAKDLQRLFELQQTRMGEATARWRAQDPAARARVMPDLGALLQWLMDDADQARQTKGAPPS